MEEKRFTDVGKIVMTTAVKSAVIASDNFRSFVYQAMGMYTRCDWGNLASDNDRELNDEAVKSGEGRIFASYACSWVSDEINTIYIITEADRSVTTIMFPEDY